MNSSSNNGHNHGAPTNDTQVPSSQGNAADTRTAAARSRLFNSATVSSGVGVGGAGRERSQRGHQRPPSQRYSSVHGNASSTTIPSSMATGRSDAPAHGGSAASAAQSSHHASGSGHNPALFDPSPFLRHGWADESGRQDGGSGGGGGRGGGGDARGRATGRSLSLWPLPLLITPCVNFCCWWFQPWPHADALCESHQLLTLTQSHSHALTITILLDCITLLRFISRRGPARSAAQLPTDSEDASVQRLLSEWAAKLELEQLLQSEVPSPQPWPPPRSTTTTAWGVDDNRDVDAYIGGRAHDHDLQRDEHHRYFGGSRDIPTADEILSRMAENVQVDVPREPSRRVPAAATAVVGSGGGGGGRGRDTGGRGGGNDDHQQQQSREKRARRHEQERRRDARLEVQEKEARRIARERRREAERLKRDEEARTARERDNVCSLAMQCPLSRCHDLLVASHDFVVSSQPRSILGTLAQPRTAMHQHHTCSHTVVLTSNYFRLLLLAQPCTTMCSHAPAPHVLTHRRAHLKLLSRAPFASAHSGALAGKEASEETRGVEKSPSNSRHAHVAARSRQHCIGPTVASPPPPPSPPRRR
jgi:hypothetical protein